LKVRRRQRAVVLTPSTENTATRESPSTSHVDEVENFATDERHSKHSSGD